MIDPKIREIDHLRWEQYHDDNDADGWWSPTLRRWSSDSDPKLGRHGATPPFDLQLPVDVAIARGVITTDHFYDGDATCFAWDHTNIENIYKSDY